MALPSTTPPDIEQLRAELHAYGKATYDDVCSECGATYRPRQSVPDTPATLTFGLPKDERTTQLERAGVDLDAVQSRVWCRKCAAIEQTRLLAVMHRAIQRKAILRHVPGQPAGLTLDGLGEADAAAAEAVAGAREWLALPTPRPNLYLYGDTGRGKTTLAALVAVEAFDAGATVGWVHVQSHLNRLKASFDGKAERPVVRLAADILVDDLGLERTTAWTRDMVGEIIVAREAEGRPMIVTANYPPSGLAAHLAGDGEAVVGRQAYLPARGQRCRRAGSERAGSPHGAAGGRSDRV